MFLGLLWNNVGIAAEREPGTDKKCLHVFEREKVFERKFLPKVNKDQGVFVTYVGCNKYYDDWSWDYSFDQDIDAAHEKAYNGCLREMDENNLTGCHLFSIDDVIVWGKDTTLVAENVEELNKNCIRKGTTEFNKKVKQLVKKNFVTVMYFGCKSMSSWYWHQSTEEDLDTSREVAYKKCLKGASKHKIETCHLFSINDTIVYGKDAAFVAKVEKEIKERSTTKVVKKKKVAKKQTKPEDAKPLNKGCIKLGTNEFNKKVKKVAKSRDAKRSALVFYFGCENSNAWNWQWKIGDDLDEAKETAYKACVASPRVKNCHLFSIGDKIVYGDAALRAKIEEKLIKKLAKRKKSGAINYVQQFLFSGHEIFSKMSPTTFKKLTFNEEKNIGNVVKRTTRNSDWSKKKTFRSFSFTAEFEDNYTAKIFVEYEKGNKNFDKAEKEALFFSHMLGQMPYFLREHNDEIYVHNDNSYDDGLGLWWAQHNKRSFHINAPRKGLKPSGRQRCREVKLYSGCAVVMVHELAHVIQDLTGIISPSKWSKARKSDKKKYVSEYAKTNSREDFAESLTAWVALRYKSEKISESDLKKFDEYIPNRLKMFDEMNFNMNPL